MQHGSVQSVIYIRRTDAKQNTAERNKHSSKIKNASNLTDELKFFECISLSL